MGNLKIVYPVCCGMDVHRDFLIACIASANAQGVTEQSRGRKPTKKMRNGSLTCSSTTSFEAASFHQRTSAITTQLLEHPGEPFDAAPFVHGRCKTPIAQIQEAVDGIFTHEQAEKLKIIRSHMGSLEKRKFEISLKQISDPPL